MDFIRKMIMDLYMFVNRFCKKQYTILVIIDRVQGKPSLFDPSEYGLEDDDGE